MKTKVRDRASDAVALGLIPGQETKITYAMWQKKKKKTSIAFGEGNGTPLQYSSLENPMDGGAW